MKTTFLDSNGKPLIVASVNGYLRLFSDPGRLAYTGPVNLITTCENNVDPCKSGSGGDCNSKNALPHFSMRPQTDIQGLKEYGEYNHQVLKEYLNFADTLPEGTCSSEKLFIYCRDAVVACEWHLEDGWIIDAIIEVPFAQCY